MNPPSKDEFIDAVVFTGLIVFTLGVAFAIGVQLARHFHWGCG